MKSRTEQEGVDAVMPDTARRMPPRGDVSASIVGPDVLRGGLSSQESTVALIDTIRELEERLRRAYDELDALHELKGRVRELEMRNAALKEEHDRRCRELADLMESMSARSHAGRAVSEQSVGGEARGILARLSNRYHRFLFGRRKARILRSGIFKARWYLEKNPDVANAGLDPLDHYLLFGRLERRQVSPYFDVVQYISENPDALDDPLTHFLEHGKGGA